MTERKHFHAATFFAGCLLATVLWAASAHAVVNPAPFSIAEKDLFHFYAASPNPATACANFTATMLADDLTALFDTPLINVVK